MASTSSIGSTTYFSGSSPYAAQLQQTIARAITIASLPMHQLQAQQNILAGQQNELGKLTSVFSSVQSAIGNLTNATGIGAFSASVGDSSIATASLSAGVMAGNYTINVLGTGSQTNAVSTNGFTSVQNPSSQNISSSSAYTLSVNGKDYVISNSAGTLNGLAQAINSSSANVQATVVNVGSSSTPTIGSLFRV
jgi:flagellar hook-associated protein 2